MEVDKNHHMDQDLRTSWHGMSAENLIIAEFDKRRMNLVQLHAFTEEDQQEVTRRWQATYHYKAINESLERTCGGVPGCELFALQ